eukprot:COSAG01_NODE_17037_length_1183_cov_1.239852_1_plen_379_part_10
MNDSTSATPKETPTTQPNFIFASFSPCTPTHQRQPLAEPTQHHHHHNNNNSSSITSKIMVNPTIAKRHRRAWQQNLLTVAMLVTASASALAREPPHEILPRTSRPLLVRMDWKKRCDSLTAKQFTRRYRIDKVGFQQMVAEITPYMPAVRRKGAISNEIKLAMTLRWLAGGSYLDIADLHGVSEEAFYTHVWQVMEAIDTVKAYRFQLLRLLSSLNLEQGRSPVEPLAEGFDAKTHGIVTGCIGAVDGIAIKLSAAALSDVPNAGSYYCRKGYHSLNFQVCCDAERRITWTSAQFCGSTHDNVALENSQLGAILTNPEHPINKTDYWLAGDDAYKGVAGKSDSILTPYPASRTYDDEKDAFNFYQSKLRIEVECCFGAL